MVQYPGLIQTAATTISRKSLIEECTLHEPLGTQECISTPLYLRATVDSGAHLTLDAKINSFEALTLVDSGATGVFMHPEFASQCNAIIKQKEVPREVRVIDGRVINSGLITHQAQVELIIGNHQESLMADITNTGRYACILGTPWLIRHDPMIRWSRREVLFDSPFCQGNCIVQEEVVPEPVVEAGTVGRHLDSLNQDTRNRKKLATIREKILSPPMPSVEQRVNTLQSNKNGNRNTKQSVPGLASASSWIGDNKTSFAAESAPKHAFVSEAGFRLSAKEAELYTLEISECNGVTGFSIPEEYCDLQGAFSEEASNKLPNHSKSDLKIEFKAG